jgi:predicted transposase YdaD
MELCHGIHSFYSLLTKLLETCQQAYTLLYHQIQSTYFMAFSLAGVAIAARVHRISTVFQKELTVLYSNLVRNLMVCLAVIYDSYFH